MEYRNIFLANPARLSVQREQLGIEQAEKITVPLEDISSVLIESQQVTLSVHAAAAMADHGITVFLCDEKHLPSCQLLPINQFCRQRKLLLSQCEMGKPLQKQLWQQIVVRKIQNQAQCLRLMGLVMFDLPVKTKAERRSATQFRNFLVGDGYHMVQYSVYARICNGRDSVETHKKRILLALPSKGSVRMLVITEKQYNAIELLVGKPTPYDKPQQFEQLMIF